MQNIMTENELIVSELLKTLNASKNESVQYQCIESLRKYGKTSPDVIIKMIELTNCSNDYIRYEVNNWLLHSGKKSLDVINNLLKTLQCCYFNDLKYVTKSLELLIHLLNKSHVNIQNKYNLKLKKLCQNNSNIMSGLTQLSTSCNDNIKTRFYATTLLIMAKQNVSESDVMLEVLKNNDIDDFLRSKAVEKLGEIGETSSKIISTLISKVNVDDYNICWYSVDSLIKLWQNKPKLIVFLKKILFSKHMDTRVRRRAFTGLCELGIKPSFDIIYNSLSVFELPEKYYDKKIKKIFVRNLYKIHSLSEILKILQNIESGDNITRIDCYESLLFNK